MNTPSSFGQWLQAALDEREWSQADLARAAHIGRSSITDAMSGRRQVGKDMATAIANALRLPPEQVFRAAGLLPPERAADPWIDEMTYKLGQLSPGLRDVAERFINSMVESEEAESKKRKHKPKNNPT